MERVRQWDEGNNLTVRFSIFPLCQVYIVATTQSLSVLEIAKEKRTGWRYVIVAIRILRALIRRDVPLSAALIQFMLEKTYSSYTNVVCALRILHYNPYSLSLIALCMLAFSTYRLFFVHRAGQYSQRSVIKSLQYIKHRTYARSPWELVQAIHHNPLKVKVLVEPSHSLLVKVLQDYKTPISKTRVREPLVVLSYILTIAHSFPWKFTGYTAINHRPVGWHGLKR